MSTATELPFQTNFSQKEVDAFGELTPLASTLRQAFGTPFSYWSRETGELCHAALEPGSNDPLRGELARALTGSEPQFIQEDDSLLVLAIPLVRSAGEAVVATAAFVSRPLGPDESPAGVARFLEINDARAALWISQQSVWSAEALHRLALSVQGQAAAEARSKKLELEVEKLSDNLATTYEEICLLHGVTQNLRISADDEHLCRLVLDWLLECLPARSIAIQLLPVAREGE